VPSNEVWGLLLLAGLMGTVGHLMLILAYTKAPAATLAPYMYMQIAIAMLSGWLVFDQVPGTLAMVGMVLITVCGAAAAWLAARPRQEQRQALV
jgi:drug/metabolite transporter (DMT)-like permease